METTMKNGIRNNEEIQRVMNSDLTAKEIAYLTGLSEEKCRKFMDVNGMSGDEALEAIDIFMQSLNDNVTVPLAVAKTLHNAGIYSEMATRLNAYNTMRGGVKGYGGFVFEELHAADAAVNGTNISVIGNNGVADFIVKDRMGNTTLVQAKSGYKNSSIDWNKYRDQTIVVDKGNVALAQKARNAGLKVQESNVFKKQADVVARTQQWESKVRGITNAPITGTVTSMHSAGLASAKFAAKIGVSMKIGENIYDAMSGTKSFEDAAVDVLVDGGALVATSYITTAALTAAGTALAGTAVGTAATAAATSAIATLGTTAAGSALVAGGTAVAATLTSIAAAPVLPVVGAGIAIGAIGKWISSKW